MSGRLYANADYSSMDHRVLFRCVVALALVSALIAFDTRAQTSTEAAGTDAVVREQVIEKPAPAAPQPFRTKYAHFRPAEFSELPGWTSDHVAQGWSAFRQSCSALARRSAWSGPCARSAGVDGSDDRKVRAFLESEFVLFQITDLQLTPTGVVTGYYEPLLNGRRERGGEFVFPVYATPDDLLFLDSRSVPGNRRAFDAIVEGRFVVPVRDTLNDGRARYRVDLGSAVADVRDKRMRMRIDGERIVPYYTRSEIDERGLQGARVLAWVDDPGVLYAMHVQGAGRIRFDDGAVLRVAYGEQNGHPFLPPLQPPTRKIGAAKAPLARGLVLDADLDDADDSAASESQRVTTRGIAPIGDGNPWAAGKRLPAADAQEEAVERMVDLLMGEPAPAPSKPDRIASATAAAPNKMGTTTTNAPVATTTGAIATPSAPNASAKGSPAATMSVSDATASHASPPAVTGTSATSTSSTMAARIDIANVKADTDASRLDARPSISTTTTTPSAKAAIVAFYGRDPSYVFFRTLPNYEGGPVGALGVPLTPQRSVAVDPRTTPLGSPVFIAAEGGTTGRWSRLVFAQDTGGAIRGPVRADFFWGFGAEAARRAGQMKQAGQMWILLPRGQAVNGLSDAIATRGIGGAQASDAECVVPDADFCVE